MDFFFFIDFIFKIVAPVTNDMGALAKKVQIFTKK